MKEAFVQGIGLTTLGGFKIDTEAPETRAAVKDFVQRVNRQEVFVEIRNPEMRNKNKAMEEYNDNVCAMIINASHDSTCDVMRVVFNPTGPAKHVLDNVEETDLEIIARVDMEMIKGVAVIKRLATFDINIKPKSV